MNKRIDELKLGIREGELRLMDKKKVGKDAIRRAVSNSKIRLLRIEAGLDEGHIVWRDGNWVYQYGE